MADARGLDRLGPPRRRRRPTARDAVFSASGTVITFRGFLAAYEEGRDDATPTTPTDAATTPPATAEKADARLPKMAEGDALTASRPRPPTATARPRRRATPRPRWSRRWRSAASAGPSTYAATISVIQDRGYVTGRGQALVPSWLAFAVTRLLEENFDWLVDYDFTAEMEEDLDEIAAGRQGPGGVAGAVLLRRRHGQRGGRGPAGPRREPRRDRRPRGQLDPDRRRHHAARRPVRPVPRGLGGRARRGRRPRSARPCPRTWRPTS